LLHTASRKNAWRDWLGAHDVELAEEPHAFDFGHFFMGLRAAERGKGVAIVPAIVLHDMSPDGDLVCPLPPDVRSAGNYYFLCRESKLKDPSVQLFRKWLFDEAAQMQS
jgi:LysR family glycine cleavage system transcriptional activator